MRNGVRIVIGFVLIALISILLISFIANRVGNGENTSQETTEQQLDLAQYAETATAAVVYTQAGKIKGEEEYREIRITVTPAERRLEVLKGYQGSVERSQTYPNNSLAYRDFLLALKTVGFAEENKDSSQENSDSACPLGRRYGYTLRDSGNSIVSTWSTTCDLDAETFAGDDSGARKLFESQIPEYRKAVRGVRL